ncbi:nucleoside-diphosphate sugar epimerase/dehydratase [Kyrpidia sp.]|uniref:SDR family NAD(P)-dependent oxidoreductase n=1 Tax=Kyrpidia sp. TaxID=2073077 RepID=UPI00258B05C3|nr:nucleoside-diphosphate sugar epimerase/dehydratase [Kyrpidia sp.]MCL6576117.1 polysaccharide biosynthesis protein [Kyrpidia sp.]
MGRWLRRIIWIGYDISIILSAVALAYGLRFDFSWDPSDMKYMPLAVILSIIILLTVYSFAHVYRKLWRYASVHELLVLGGATTLAIPFLYICSHILHSLIGRIVIPRSIFLIAYPFVLMGVGGGRLIWRVAADIVSNRMEKGIRVLIVGAGQAGVMVAKELRNQPTGRRIPVGFIDDDPAKLHMELLGVPVLGCRNDIPSAVKRYGIDEIIVAIPSAPLKEIQSIISICRQCHIRIRMLPDLKTILAGSSMIRLIRDVRVEDLLRRDPVNLDVDGIARFLTGKRVLVTGAGGSIGSELCRQVAAFDAELLILVGHGEHSIYSIDRELKSLFPHIQTVSCIADIQDRKRIEEVVSHYRPEVIFHAAAHKHVPLMEMNPTEAVKNNVFGTVNVADIAHDYHVERFVMISTDKAVNPTNVLGATKRVAEMYVQALNGKSRTIFVSVRFGNVLGSRGSVIPLFQEQIENGGPVTVTHPDMTRYFMTIPEAAQLVIQAGAMARGGEVFLLDMGKPVRIVELAEDLIRLSGYQPGKDIEIDFVGIRPGEKLHEEMLTHDEGAHVTKHDRIYIGGGGDVPSYKKLVAGIESLSRILEEERDLPVQSVKIKLALQRLVPNYQAYLDDEQQQIADTVQRVPWSDSRVLS